MPDEGIELIYKDFPIHVLRDQGKCRTAHPFHVLLFEDCGAPEAVKSANYIRATFRADSDPRPGLSMLYDYNTKTPPVPDSYLQTPSPAWGTAKWGAAKWGASRQLDIYEAEKSARGMGYVLAPCVQVTSSGESTPQIELSRLEIGYDLSGSLS